MKDDTLQRNNTDFSSGTGAQNYKKILTFNVLIKYVEKKSKV